MGIAALDPASGVPLSWNPGRDRGLAVWRITPTAQGLYVLNDSLNFGGEYHARFTYLLTAGGTAPVRGTQHSLPTNLVYTGTTVAGGSVTPGQLSQRAYDGTTFADEALSGDTSSWSSVVGVIQADGVSYRLTTSRRFERSTDGGATWTLIASWTDGRLPDINAMTYVNGLLYYTVNGSSRLYEVAFGVENGLMSTLPARVVSGDGDGLDWSNVRGLVFAGGKLLATSDRRPPPAGGPRRPPARAGLARPAQRAGRRQPRLVERPRPARQRPVGAAAGRDAAPRRGALRPRARRLDEHGRLHQRRHRRVHPPVRPRRPRPTSTAPGRRARGRSPRPPLPRCARRSR